MTTPETPTRVLPQAEIDRKNEERDLLAKLEENRKRRQYAIVEQAELTDGTIGPVLVCPFCKSDDLQYEENGGLCRSIDGFAEPVNELPAVLNIDSHYDVNDEGSDDPRLWCRNCSEESQLPDDIEIDWV